MASWVVFTVFGIFVFAPEFLGTHAAAVVKAYRAALSSIKESGVE